MEFLNGGYKSRLTKTKITEENNSMMNREEIVSKNKMKIIELGRSRKRFSLEMIIDQIKDFPF